MGSFSNLIDISSFFIGVLINLLLVALVCYYFKRKIDNLEVSQSEQAKMLYSLISRQEQEQRENVIMNSSEHNQQEGNIMSQHNLSFLQNLDLNSLGTTHNSIVEIPNTEINFSGSDSDSDSESDSDSDNEQDDHSEPESDDENQRETKVLNYKEQDAATNEIISVEQEVKSIQYNEVDNHEENVDYEKMTIKELKSLIESKGLHIKKNSKKQELIEILVQEENNISVEKVEAVESNEKSDTEDSHHVVSEDEEEQLIESDPELVVEDDSELNVIEG